MEINGIEYSEEYLKNLTELGIEASKSAIMFKEYIYLCQNLNITLEEGITAIQSIANNDIFKNLDTSKISDIFSNR